MPRDKTYLPEAEEEWNRSPTHASRHAVGGADAVDGNDLFVSSTTAPSSPSAGDRYFDETISLWMIYDGTREKWLSEEVRQVIFSGGTIAPSSYFFGGNIPMSATLGVPAAKGTIVEVAFGRTDGDSTTIEVVDTDGSSTTLLGEQSSAAAGLTRNAAVDWDHTLGMLSVRVKSDAAEMSNVIGVIFYRLRP